MAHFLRGQGPLLHPAYGADAVAAGVPPLAGRAGQGRGGTYLICTSESKFVCLSMYKLRVCIHPRHGADALASARFLHHPPTFTSNPNYIKFKLKNIKKGPRRPQAHPAGGGSGKRTRRHPLRDRGGAARGRGRMDRFVCGEGVHAVSDDAGVLGPVAAAVLGD